jgi:hypothetical protein
MVRSEVGGDRITRLSGYSKSFDFTSSAMGGTMP